ncbi:uncharacterized protein LOC128882758 [Hylaeus volcanicus]|uniref:uncharacterized protein LOC128882758 n=1 Tax=Hylaeus volcanicus TaxID=313075 RepID=UPI0023B812A5|nr:uncharacterized protein LOC128882758 [Hylaeus volcanicus]
MWSNAEIGRATRENLPNKEFNQPLTKKSRTHDSDNVHSECRVTRVVHILGRKYPLTDTFYKYLDIEVRIGGSCDVELAIGDSRGNEIKFSMDTWKDLLRKRHNILQIFADTSETSSEPISINDVTVKFRQLNDVKLARLSNSTVSMFMSEKTVQKLFGFEYCIDHMYSWLSEILYLVESKYNRFIEIIQNAEIKDYAKAIVESENFERHSLIDSELLALGLDVMLEYSYQ